MVKILFDYFTTNDKTEIETYFFLIFFETFKKELSGKIHPHLHLCLFCSKAALTLIYVFI